MPENILVTMDIDRKYKIEARNPCSGSIHTEKDAVLFLAKDRAFLEGALPGYRAKCVELGANPAHVESVDLLIQRVDTYQRLMESKIPDTDLPCEIRRCVDGENVESVLEIDIDAHYKHFMLTIQHEDVLRKVERLSIDIIDRYYGRSNTRKDYVCKLFNVLSTTANFNVVKVVRLLLLDIKMEFISGQGIFQLIIPEIEHINEQLAKMTHLSVK